MKFKILASVAAIGFMVSTAQAVTLLSIAGGKSVVLKPANLPNNTGFNPGGMAFSQYVVSGNTVTDTQNLAVGGAAATGGLKLNQSNVKLVFTFLGKEAGFRNAVFQGTQLFMNNAATGTHVSRSGVSPGVGGFLPFKFISDLLGSPKDIVNGHNTASFGSIAFKLLAKATKTHATVVALLNDTYKGDADFDDMVVLIDATQVNPVRDVLFDDHGRGDDRDRAAGIREPGLRSN